MKSYRCVLDGVESIVEADDSSEALRVAREQMSVQHVGQQSAVEMSAEEIAAMQAEVAKPKRKKKQAGQADGEQSQSSDAGSDVTE